jgi:outer membrane protein assembly factor BamB
MSIYQLMPPESPHERPRWLITTVLLAIVLLLIGAGGIVWLGPNPLWFGPTATWTATPAPARTATPDFRATRVAEDQATQMAYQATQVAYESVVTRQTPNQNFLPGVVNDPGQTPTPKMVNLVPVSGGNPDAQNTAASNPAAAPTPTETPAANSPLDASGVDSPLPTPTPTDAGVIIVVTDTATPTATPPLLPTDTPTLPPTFTSTPAPTVFMVNSLKAVVAAPTPSVIWLRQAPSIIVTPVSTAVLNTTVDLLGRDNSGEWVYVYLQPPNAPGAYWIRQLYAVPGNNSWPANATPPPSATPNDVRWLPVQAWPGNIAQPATATPIPAGDFPTLRYDRGNSAQLARPLPSNLVSPPQIFSAELAKAPSAPVVVASSSIVVAGADKHLYWFDRTIGNQLAKLNVGDDNSLVEDLLALPPLVHDNIVYFANDGGWLYAVPAYGGNPLWKQQLTQPSNRSFILNPATGLAAAGNYLFLGGKLELDTGDSDYYVLQIDRANGTTVREFRVGNTPLKELAIGQQLLYAAGKSLWALDVQNFDLIWQRTDVGILRSPPLYTLNGPTSLAELYIARQPDEQKPDSVIELLDANTGALLRSYKSNSELIDRLVVGDKAIYGAGTAFVKAYERQSDKQLWRASVNGAISQTPLAGSDYLILVNTSGLFQFIRTSDGTVLIGPAINTGAQHGLAVAGNEVFVPTDNGRVYKYILQ